MKTYNFIMDKLLEKKVKFSQRFGRAQFLDDKEVKLDKKTVETNKIDFSDEIFLTVENFNLQNKKYNTKNNFICQHKGCCKTFTSMYGLRYHMDHVHSFEKSEEIRPFSCNVKKCGRKYKNNNGLKYHMFHTHGCAESNY